MLPRLRENNIEIKRSRDGRARKFSHMHMLSVQCKQNEIERLQKISTENVEGTANFSFDANENSCKQI